MAAYLCATGEPEAVAWRHHLLIQALQWIKSPTFSNSVYWYFSSAYNGQMPVATYEAVLVEAIVIVMLSFSTRQQICAVMTVLFLFRFCGSRCSCPVPTASCPSPPLWHSWTFPRQLSLVTGPRPPSMQSCPLTSSFPLCNRCRVCLPQGQGLCSQNNSEQEWADSQDHMEGLWKGPLGYFREQRR